MATNLARFALLSACFAADGAAQTVWSQVFAFTSPPPRHSAVMAQDTLRDRIVLWGGTDFAGARNDTWEFDAAAQTWLQYSGSQAPPASSRSAMAYDRGRGRMVLVVSAPSTGIAETWEYDGTSWVHPALPASPLLGTSQFLLVHDLSRGVCVLTAQGATQTWEYGGSTWTQRAPGPGPRERACMAFDVHRARTVMHGGVNGANPPLGDTWEYDGTSWALVCSGPAIADASATFDAARRRVVVLHRGTGPTNVTYEFNGSSWQTINAPWIVSPVTAVALAHDFVRHRTLSFGGLGNGFLIYLTREFWTLQPATVAPFGQGCAGTSIAPGFAPLPYQLPFVGMTFGARLYAAPFGQPSVIAFGTSDIAAAATPLPLSLDPVGMTNCSLYTSAEILLATAVSGANASASFFVPPAPQLVGAQFFLQGFAAEPGGNAAGLIATGALACTIGSL